MSKLYTTQDQSLYARQSQPLTMRVKVDEESSNMKIASLEEKIRVMREKEILYEQKIH